MRFGCILIISESIYASEGMAATKETSDLDKLIRVESGEGVFGVREDTNFLFIIDCCLLIITN